MLEQSGYDSDPVKKWKKFQAELQNHQLERGGQEEEGEEEEDGSESDYNYILAMQLWSLTKERKEELLKQRDQKADQLYTLKKKSATDLWSEDLDAFIVELDVSFFNHYLSFYISLKSFYDKSWF